MYALHYKHTGNIPPADAAIIVRWCANADLPEFITEEMKVFVAGTTEKPTVVRKGKNLFDPVRL